jgi:hypothetical protein
VITASNIDTNILFQIKLLPNIDQLFVHELLVEPSVVFKNDLTIINTNGIITKSKVITAKGISNNQRFVDLM